MRRKLFFFIFIYSFSLFILPLVSAQVQDMRLSVEQFTAINKAKEDVKKIKKGKTTEKEIKEWFGVKPGMLYLEEKDSEADIKEARNVFDRILYEHIPADLHAKYSFPTMEQKFLYYIFPWTFEHPVPCQSKKSECSTHENLVVLVTINKKTGLVEESASFDFHFEREFKQ